MATATKPPAAARKMFEIATAGRNLPGRYFIYGSEKIGKTSLAAHMPGPLFVQVKGETGLETLIDAGQLPPVPHLPGEVDSWQQMLDVVAWVATEAHDRKTLVIDGIDSLQKLCFEHIRDTHFSGDEGKFMAYYKGFAMSPNVWKELLVALDALRVKRKNPSGEDWTSYTPNLHEHIWEQTAAWMDAIFFMDFYRRVGDDGKAHGDDSVRTLYCQHDASYDAGNRFGLTEEIDCGNSAQEAWNNLAAALKAARTGKES